MRIVRRRIWPPLTVSEALKELLAQAQPAAASAVPEPCLALWDHWLARSYDLPSDYNAKILGMRLGADTCVWRRFGDGNETVVRALSGGLACVGLACAGARAARPRAPGARAEREGKVGWVGSCCCLHALMSWGAATCRWGAKPADGGAPTCAD